MGHLNSAPAQQPGHCPGDHWWSRGIIWGKRGSAPLPGETLAVASEASGCSSHYCGTTAPPGAAEHRIGLPVMVVFVNAFFWNEY